MKKITPTQTTLFLITLVTVILFNTGSMATKADPTPEEAQLESPGTQTICPVMGGKIDKTLFVDVQGKRIYMCCLACEDGIMTEPDRYIKKIHEKNEEPAVLKK